MAGFPTQSPQQQTQPLQQPPSSRRLPSDLRHKIARCYVDDREFKDDTVKKLVTMSPIFLYRALSIAAFLDLSYDEVSLFSHIRFLFLHNVFLFLHQLSLESTLNHLYG